MRAASKAGVILVLAISAIALTWAVHTLFEYPHEDAFIHLRIARNLALRTRMPPGLAESATPMV
jgi:hypothetical protein